MNTFTTKSTVNSQEAEALKEMIFNRVRARAEAMNKETQESYVDNFQNEIMDLARSSFVKTNNPFADNSQPTTVNTTQFKTDEIVLEKSNKNSDSFGFATQQASYIASQIKLKSSVKNEEIAKSTIESTMDDAHKSLEKKSSFMGALNFLNSQATISLVNKKGTRFEANA